MLRGRGDGHEEWVWAWRGVSPPYCTQPLLRPFPSMQLLHTGKWQRVWGVVVSAAYVSDTDDDEVTYVAAGSDKAHVMLSHWRCRSAPLPVTPLHQSPFIIDHPSSITIIISSSSSLMISIITQAISSASCICLQFPRAQSIGFHTECRAKKQYILGPTGTTVR